MIGYIWLKIKFGEHFTKEIGNLKLKKKLNLESKKMSKGKGELYLVWQENKRY